MKLDEMLKLKGTVETFQDWTLKLFEAGLGDMYMLTHPNKNSITFVNLYTGKTYIDEKTKKVVRETFNIESIHTVLKYFKLNAN